MTSTYRGYTIDHDRNHAHAWRGEQSNRMPDVAATDLAAAMRVIDCLIEYDAQLAAQEGKVLE